MIYCKCRLSFYKCCDKSSLQHRLQCVHNKKQNCITKNNIIIKTIKIYSKAFLCVQLAKLLKLKNIIDFFTYKRNVEIYVEIFYVI